MIGATNRREVVDDAILSRFGMELELTLPDEKNRMAILNQELAEAGFKGTPRQRFEPYAGYVWPRYFDAGPAVGW